MLKIEKDTTQRGTEERPQYVIFLRYGNRPAIECWLDARTDADALAEAGRRFPDCTFRLAPEASHA